MCEDRKRLVLFGPRSWTLNTYSDTGSCCSLSGTNYRRRETRRHLSCLLRAGQKATLWTAPAPILKRSFKSACTRPTGDSSRRLRMRLRGFGRGHSASVNPASNRSPRLVWKLYLGGGSAGSARSESSQPHDPEPNLRHSKKPILESVMHPARIAPHSKGNGFGPHSDKTTSQMG
jgi:hypothetical protein